MELNGKSVFITGGSSGIGLACAEYAAARGANIAIFARDKKRLKAASERIKKCRAGGAQKINAYPLDVARHHDVEKVMKRAVKETGDPYILINSAGIGGAFNFEKVSYGRFDDTMKINLYGTRNTVASLLPYMKKAGGHIVNVSSIGGFIGVFGYTAYAASKFAVIGFSETLRSEFKRWNINVSVLCPPDTDTPMLHSEGRDRPEETIAIAGNAGLKSPEFVAAAMYRAMERKKFMIIPGAMGRLIFLVKRLFPWFPEMMMDSTVRKIQKARER